MTAARDRAIALYGTDEPVVPGLLLRAGPLAAEFEAGILRHIRVSGTEILRAIGFILRDPQWGTYDPEITGLEIDQREDGFTVRYSALAQDERQSFAYRVVIEGRADRIDMRAEGASVHGFETNRTGFVVLHPVQGVAGAPVEVEHVDGRLVQGRFPDRIDPVQPMMDLRALTHEPIPGLRVTCRMEGDVFEMEDQRNWCDASYKTYVRPLSRPWPYRLEPGEVLDQSVSLVIAGAAPAPPSAGEAVRLSIGERTGVAPRLGLGFDPAEYDATARVLPELAELRPQMLVCHHDPRRGHDRDTLEAALSVAAALGAEPWLEGVVAEVDAFEAEIRGLGDLVRSLGSPFRSVLLSPAADLKSTPPGQPWPKAPPPEAFYRAARAAFPDVRLGGGMISTFTELNRKRPPLDDLDFVGFTTMALVHAADDVSVLEGLEALPSIARSARAIAGSLPLCVGPSAIGLRHNPYAVGPMPNPHNGRRAMAWNDPRQRARLGAAWAAGYVAHLARAGVDSVTLGGTTGPFGVVHTRQDWPTPGYGAEGARYPIFAVLESLARLAGKPLRAVGVSRPGDVQALAVDADGGIDLVVANLTADPQDIDLGRPAGSIRMLNRPTGECPAPSSGPVRLEAYEVALVRC